MTIFNITISLTLLTTLKFLFILFLVFLNIGLVYLEYKLYKAKAVNSKLLTAGILDSNIAKTLKNIGVAVTSLASLYGAGVAYKQNNRETLETVKKIGELENSVSLLKTQAYESTILSQDIKNKMKASSSNIQTEIQNTLQNLKKFAINSKSIDEKKGALLNLKKGESSMAQKIQDEIEILQKTNTYLDTNIRKSMDNTLKISKDLEETNETKEAFLGINFNLSEMLESFNPMEKFAFSVLILSQVVFSSLITIVYIFYGDYLIKKFNLENRYPRLAKVIELRRKFQSYYLLLSVGWILVSILIECGFCIMILTA